MDSLHLVTDPFHGEWNYTILPKPIPKIDTVIY
jgi:hypothetical protein